jgi:hypothetical protein
MEVVFHEGHLPSTIVNLKSLENNFCSYHAISSCFLLFLADVVNGHLPLRMSSMEVIFQFFKIYVIVLSSNRVDLQLLGRRFCSFQAISLLSRTGGWPAGWRNQY